jgi:hypothetical protein
MLSIISMTETFHGILVRDGLAAVDMRNLTKDPSPQKGRGRGLKCCRRVFRDHLLLLWVKMCDFSRWDGFLMIGCARDG